MCNKVNLIYFVLLLLLCSCSSDFDSLYGGSGSEGTPVRFTAEWPHDDRPASRAIADKLEFKDKDVIQVSAVFKLDPKTTGGTEKTVTKYTSLTFENGNWINKTTSDKFNMDWPWNALSGSFTAYYLSDWNGPITDVGKPSKPVLLDRFEYEGRVINPDPLKAEIKDVPYGHAVDLKFNHLCTRLVIEDIGSENEYWLKLKTPSDDNVLSNACTITLNADNTLAFGFVGEESKKISSGVDDVNGRRSITFNLDPDMDYSTFSLTHRNGYSYLTIYNVEDLRKGMLKAGETYVLSLKDFIGNINQDYMDDDWWEGSEPEVIYKDFIVQDFLDAIEKCKEDYTCHVDGKDITLLKKDPYRQEMLLMEAVDFQNAEFDPVILHSFVTFDGGGKKCGIYNLKHPLFKTIYGKVTALQLRNAKLEYDDSDAEPNADWGLGVLGRVCDGAHISNVKLADAEVNVRIMNNTNEDRTYNIGSLIGQMKSGELSDVTLMNDITVKVQSENENSYIVCVGGVIGQSSGEVHNIDNSDLMTVTNSCIGHSSRYTGGLVGLLTGQISNCDVNTNVDSSGAAGSWNYAGGIVGSARTSNASTPAYIRNSTVSGRVEGGMAKGYNALGTHSSTGGMVGHVHEAEVSNGEVFSKVHVDPGYGATTENLYYTIGGVVGAISVNSNMIRKNYGNIYFDSSIYTQPHYIVGNFCGGGGDETDLRSKGNAARGNGSFVGYENQ